MKQAFIFLTFCIFLAPTQSFGAENARVYFNDVDVAVAPGSEIGVSIFLDTLYVTNAFDLEVKFPAEKLKFLNADNSSSLADIWQPQPKLAGSGKIILAGGLFKSFVGKGGNVAKLYFRVEDNGVSGDEANITFGKHDIYLADGRGTKIPNDAGEFKLTIDKNAKIFSETGEQFESTLANKNIDKELSKVKIKMFLQNSLLILAVLVVLVFSRRKVYNK